MRTIPVGSAKPLFAVSPFPISVYGTFQWEEPRDSVESGGARLERELRIIGGNGYVTASPTPDDRIVAFTNYSNVEEFQQFLPVPPDLEIGDDSSGLISGLAWSHTFGYRNVGNAALFFKELRTGDSLTIRDPSGAGGSINLEARERTYIAAVNHIYGDGDFTWRYGVEGGKVRSDSRLNAIPLLASSTQAVAKAYIDGLYEITPDLKVEGALFARYIEDVHDNDVRLEPKLGVAWAPTDGHWLRAAIQREGYNFGSATLAPIGIVGLQPNQFLIGSDGYADTLALRWDAEWNDWLFTAVDYQHQEIRDGSIAFPVTSPFLVQTDFPFDKGRLDRVAVTANLALGHGFGLSTTLAHTESENLSAGDGGDLPFLPEYSGQIALTFVSTANIKTTVAANYIGERNDSSTTLDDFWTLDASLQWEPFDKRIEVELAGFNLLDEEFELRDGLPGWGPTVKGTVKVRF